MSDDLLQNGSSNTEQQRPRTQDTDGRVTQAEPTLSARGLVKIYEGKERVLAVDDVTFEVNHGEFVSIIGPSGSGKSTILRIIAGFEEPTEGEVVLDGAYITDRPPFERDTNMMFQDLALFPHYSVKKNIAYGPRQQGIPKAERETMVAEMLDLIQLSGYEGRAIDELSGGEKQRVALARCLINEPKLVLFDEPLASLDRQLRRNMTTELRNIQDRTGSTFLYVTHNQEVALSVSDRVIVLNGGEIEQIGTPDELYNAPRTEFVANFIGDMNGFTATVSENDDRSGAVDVGATPIPVPPGQDWLSAGSERKIRVGIRPHDFEVVSQRNDVSDCYVEGIVKGAVFDGDRDVITVDTEFGELTAKTEATVSEGSILYLQFSPGDVHLFPSAEVNDE